MVATGKPSEDGSRPETLAAAEQALKQMGYSRIVREKPETVVQPEFWVQESGVPRRTFPVFVEPREKGPAPSHRVEQYGRTPGAWQRAPIVVVPNEKAAKAVWDRVRGAGDELRDVELSILVVPRSPGSTRGHWHTGIVSPKELLRLATGIVVGLYRRAATEEGGGVDFEELLAHLKARYKIDVNGSLSVENDADALWILYQLAQRYSYAPGDQGGSLHMLVVKPTGAGARLPWFAA
jgi:hypothetical protein